MCGRYFNKSEKQQIADRLKAGKVFADPYIPNYNIAPTTFQPILRQQRDSTDRELLLARWGLIPFWAKDPKALKLSTFNAKAETLMDKPMWATPFKKFWRKNAQNC